jgi:hypothetical protein
MPFNNRLNYDAVSRAKQMEATASGPINVAWDPSDFPNRIDSQGASGFVGGGSQTKIPTGVALASRITESLDMAVGLKADSPKVLNIKIIKAESKFQYSAGFFNVTPVIDQGSCDFEAQFTCGDKSWTGKYTSATKDKAIGGSSSTGVLERVWDDIASQVCKDVVEHLKP